MKPADKQSDAELAYNRDDAAEAVSANPLGHKAEQYLAQARACAKELGRRGLLRNARGVLRAEVDPLTIELKYRRRLHPNWAIRYRYGALLRVGQERRSR